jgi:hypothetical protein
VLAGQSAGLAGRVTLHLELAELAGQWTPQLELVGLVAQPAVAGQPAFAASQPALAASRDRSLC